MLFGKPHSEFFVSGKIERKDPWTDQRVPSDIAEGSFRLFDERRRIEPARGRRVTWIRADASCVWPIKTGACARRSTPPIVTVCGNPL